MLLIDQTIPDTFSVENRDDIVPEIPPHQYHLPKGVLYDKADSQNPSFFGNIAHSAYNLLYKLYYAGKSITAHGAYLSHYTR